jgi:hypothetical protein
MTDLTNDYVIARRDLVVAMHVGRHGGRLAMLLDWLIRHCGSEQLTLRISAQDISDFMLGTMSRSAVLDGLRLLVAWGLVVRERPVNGGGAHCYGVDHAKVLERFKEKRQYLPADDDSRSDEALSGLRQYLDQHNSTPVAGPTIVQ